jgi:hypothetical protein
LQNYVKKIPVPVYVMVDAMYEGVSTADEKQILATTPTTGGVRGCPPIAHILNTEQKAR